MAFPIPRPAGAFPADTPGLPQAAAEARVREERSLGTWGLQMESGLGHFSPQACEVLGLPRGTQLTLEQLLDCFAPEQREELRATFIRSIQEGRCFDAQAQVLRAGGARRWVRLTCESDWDPAQGCLHLFGALEDITGQLQVAAELRESRRMMAMLVGNLPGMAYRCANVRDWPLEFASDGAWELTGYTPAQLTAGQPSYGALIHPDDEAAVWNGVQEAIAARRRFQLNYRLRTAWGEKWVWEQGCGVYEPDGSLRCIEGFITDVTHARQAEEELARLNRTLEARVRERTAQLESANAELEAFAYSIAHDLRAPMTSLAGYARVLEQGLTDADTRHAHFLQRIVHNVQQMSELTDALLALARLSGVEIACEPVDLSALAHAVLAQQREQEPGRAVEARIQPAMRAWGDRRLLQQVLANLIGNAWKFSRDRELVWIEVGASTLGGEQVVHVSDRGCGFDMAHARQLFSAFRRVHPDYEGTGIGLALVRKIVQRHGGRTWAESQAGVGTTIYFALPAGADLPEPAAAARLPAEAHATS